MSTHSDPAAGISGAYADGRNPVSIPVDVTFADDGIRFQAPGWPTGKVWSYGTLSSNAPVKARARDALLRSAEHEHETLFLSGADLGRALLEKAPALGPVRQRLACARPGFATVAAVAVLAGGIHLSGWSPSQTVARHLPQNARENMGIATVQSMAGRYRVCETPQSRAALERLTTRLVQAAGKDPLKVKVRVVDWGLVNAFAAPGGQILLTRGLLTTAQSPDEVAGVLAHELGHALELHPETSIVRLAGLSAAGQLIFAGSSGAVSNLGLLVTEIQYTRVAEHEADAHAVRILKGAQISAKGFADFFKRMDSPDERSVFNNAAVRTHPLTTERIAFVNSQPAYPATPALTTEDWLALQSACAPMDPKVAKTIADATEALAKTPDDIEQLKRRAEAYGRIGRHPQALADWDKAVSLKPGEAALHIARGGTLDSLRRHEDALKAYEEALRITPNHTGAMNRHALSNRSLKRYDEALKEFDTLIATNPKVTAAHYNRGLVLLDLKRTEDARAAFDNAIALDKTYAAAYTHRGLIHEGAQRTELAVADFRAALASQSKLESTAWAHKTARERLAKLGVPEKT